MPLIKLKNHTVQFMCSVEELYEKEELMDSEIVTSEGLISAHKLILALNSPYIKKLLMNNIGMMSFVFKEVEHHIMRLIVDMMYYGKVDVAEADMARFMETAKLLQITSVNCASLNTSEAFSMRNTSENNDAATCSVNGVKSNEQELCFVESKKMCYHDPIPERRDGSNNILEIHSPETDERNILAKDLSEGMILNSRVIAKDEVCTDEEDFLDELSPFTFVAVPSFPVKCEDAEYEKCTSPIGEMQLINPLAEYSHNCDNFKQEPEILSESQIKIENEKEKSNNEAKKGNLGCSSHIQFHDKRKPSSNETSVIVGYNLLCENKPINDESNTYVSIDEGIVEEADDIIVKYESTCKISEFDLEKENSLDSNLDIVDNEGVGQLSLIKEHEVVTRAEAELSPIGCTDLKEEQDSLSTSKCQMNSEVAFKIINTFDAMDEGCGNSAVGRNLCALNSEEPKELNKTFDGAETLKSMECATELNPDNNCKRKTPLNGKRLSCNAGHLILDEDLERHSHCDKSKNPFQCLISKKNFCGKRDLKKNISAHCAVKTYSCQVCKVFFSCMSLLQRHMRTHIGEKPFSSNIYNKTFSKKINQEVHVRTDIGEKPFSCDICQKLFFKNNDLKRHIRTHTGEKPFSCKICQKSFSLKQGLEFHIRIHTGEKPFSCDICQKSFSRKQNLNIHIHTHTGEKPFSCDICERRFSVNAELKRHIRTHTGEKPYSCDICQKRFSRKETLHTHIRTHTGEKPYFCDICRKPFSLKQSLKIHICSHTGETPFSCDICQKRFFAKCKLEDHTRTHTGEKPFSCDTCGKSFSRKGDLLKHIRTHTGEKPFSCDICQKHFSRKGSLHKHIRTHTGE